MDQIKRIPKSQKIKRMRLFNRVLIAADLSDMDRLLFDFSKRLFSKSGAEKIYPIHIIPDFTKPEKPLLDFHQRFTMGYPVDEKVRDLLEQQAEGSFAGLDIPCHVEVVEGKPYEKLLHMAEAKEIGLVIAGIKNISERSGITPKRLARKLRCDLLLVPEKVKGTLTKLIVPVDFSSNSARALLFALELRKAIDPQMPVVALNVVHLLPVAHYYGLTENNDYRQLIKEAAEQQFNEFLEKYKLDNEKLEIEVIEDYLDNVAGQINEFVSESPGSMLIVGAKGHKAIDGFLFGSVAEELVNKIQESPILIIR